MSTFEQFLAVKNLGVAVGVSDPAVLVAARESDGTRGPLRLNASTHELLVKAAALEALLGEVQASPTANTVLDRLKAIYAALTTAASPVPVGFPDPATGLIIDPTSPVPGLRVYSKQLVTPTGITYTSASAQAPKLLSVHPDGGSNITVANGGILAFDMTAAPKGWIAGSVARKSGPSITNFTAFILMLYEVPTITAGAGKGDGALTSDAVNFDLSETFVGRNPVMIGRANGANGSMISGQVQDGPIPPGFPYDVSERADKNLYGLVYMTAPYVRPDAETFDIGILVWPAR